MLWVFGGIMLITAKAKGIYFLGFSQRTLFVRQHWSLKIKALELFVPRGRDL